MRDNYLRIHPFFLIILSGFLLRILFFTYGADIFYGKNIYINGDSFSWTESFLNLWNKGIYGIWIGNIDSYMGRGPGYPFFWGMHYLIFGPSLVYQAVAVTQLVLDTIAIWMIFEIAMILSKNKKVALSSALLYALYPFSIAWITITASESFSTFLVILIIWFYLKYSLTTKNLFILGLLVSYATLTRPFLGLFLPILSFQMMLDSATWSKRIFKVFILNLAFLIIYGIWPLRNYINYNKGVIFTSKGSGYYDYQEDLWAFRDWVFSWQSDLQYYQSLNEQVVRTEDHIIVPKDVFQNNSERLLFNELIEMCRSCGPSFLYLKTRRKVVENELNCKEEINAGFDYLRNSYREKHFYYSQFVIPLKALQRSVFKLSLSESTTVGETSPFVRLIFIYRTVAIILGFLGIIYLTFVAHRSHLIIVLYPVAWYLILPMMMPYLQYRYFLQADVLLLFSIPLAIGHMLERKGKGRKERLASGTSSCA